MALARTRRPTSTNKQTASVTSRNDVTGSINNDVTARRSQLVATKLEALVSDHVGTRISATAETFSGGAALVQDGAAWVLADDQPARSLGTALVWAIRQSATALHLVASSDTGLLARRAAAFALPTTVWFVQGREMLAAVAEPLPQSSPPPTSHDELRALIVEGGAIPHVEHGVLTGEVRGLEVCRVVETPTTGYLGDVGDRGGLVAVDEGVQLEVGVGAADREAFQIIHGAVPTVEALANVVDAVERHRSIDSPHHPLNRLGAERFLRWQAEHEPGRVGCVTLVATEPPLPRPNLKDPTPCVATGRRRDGTIVQVVFSSGVDLDALPFAADVQIQHGDPVALALPARDVLPVVSELAGLLRNPIDIISLSTT